MLNERAIIELISREIPSGPARISETWSHDAEVCAFEGDRLLFTTDEFSDEDRFPAADPFSLGWNIAAGAISDIIAVGGTPLYFAHALTVDKRWDTAFLTRYCKGVRSVLEHYDVTFIGGDIGRSTNWRCTISIIGKPLHRIVGRKGANVGDWLYVTGKIGGGNYNAALTLFKSNVTTSLATRSAVRFSILHRYLPVVTRFATACIDTSDGLFAALSTLADKNRLGFQVDSIPTLKRGIIAARMFALPEELLFLGECGEYELLFSAREHDRKNIFSTAKKLKCPLYCIGKLTGTSDRRTITSEKRTLDLSGSAIRARDFPDTNTYLKAMKQWIQTAKNG